MGNRLQEVVGTRTRYSRVKEWENGKVTPSAETVAALAMLHPLDPRGCLKWLREGGVMPRLHVDRNEQGSKVTQPRPNHDRDLEVIETVNRCALVVAEILRSDDQRPPRVALADLDARKQRVNDAEDRPEAEEG